MESSWVGSRVARCGSRRRGWALYPLITGRHRDRLGWKGQPISRSSRWTGVHVIRATDDGSMSGEVRA